MNINFLDFDRVEQGIKPALAQIIRPDEELAQRIRDTTDKLRDADAFAEADKRMRGEK